MATFQDINSFDWTSIIPAQQQQPQQQPLQLQLPQQDRLVKPEEDWFNRILVSEQQQQQSQSSTNATNTTVNTAATSPLEFSSLFDIQEREFDEESLFSNSNLTSMDNSPLIKAEEFSQSLFIPKLDLQASNFQLQQPQQQQLEQGRNLSVCSSIADFSEADGPATTTTATGVAGETKKPKKKRAPRKRLTPHQKQAHNKIEKRYRININAKIAGLQQIIPWVSNEKTAFETGEGATGAQENSSGDDAVPKLNKSMILEKATSYILHLQENERLMTEKLETLRNKVLELGGDLSQL